MSTTPFVANPLSAYASYTYSFKLYALDPETHSKIVSTNVDYEKIHNSVENASKQAVIIESGVTNMMIDDLSITSYPTSTDATILSKLSFKVTQPKGFSFIESIVAAGTHCGWDSFISSPFLMLEIKFRGWSDERFNTEVPKVLKTITIPIQISKVNTELDGGGSRYSVDASVLFDWSRQVYSNTMAAMTIDHCVTFSDFLKKFQESMNAEIEKDKTQNDTYKTLHIFEVDDNLSSVRLNTVVDSDNVLFNSTAASDQGDVKGASFTIPNQMSIPKILESVLTASQEIQNRLKIDDREAMFGHMFQIDPTVRIKKFNYAMGEYTFDIIWKIRAVPTQLIRNINSTNVSSKGLDFINNAEYCKFSKVYFHYYTGRNSEVLSANLDLSKLYFNKLARYNSLFSTEANNGGIVKGETTTKDEIKESLKHANENPELAAKGISAKPKYQNDQKSIYVDDIDVATIENMSNQRMYYRFARDTQSSIPQKTTGDSAKLKAQSVADELRNIRNQLYLSAMNLTMEIKGDPYWLTPIHGNYETNSLERLSNIKPNYIGFMTGFPNEVQERGVRNDFMFSGIYLVKNVISSFNAGKFTQKLECARFHHIDSRTFQNNYYKRNNNGEE